MRFLWTTAGFAAVERGCHGSMAPMQPLTLSDMKLSPLRVLRASAGWSAILSLLRSGWSWIRRYRTARGQLTRWPSFTSLKDTMSS